MATVAPAYAPSRTFFRRTALGLAIFILFGFAQFSLRGLVDVTAAPIVVHLHALAMLGWLALFVVQAGLPSRGALALHRKLGWTSLALVPLVVVLSIATCVVTLQDNRVPPFFTPPFFLALVIVEVSVFAALVAWAIAWRKRTDWHRRLMLGAAVILLEPALGRTLPMPLLGEWASLVIVACQLGVVALMVVHDRRSKGSVHPASVASGVAVILAHLLIALLAIWPAWGTLAERVAGAG